MAHPQIHWMESIPDLLPLPGEQVLAADTQGRLVVLGHTHLVGAALHLQAGVFGRVQG